MITKSKLWKIVVPLLGITLLGIITNVVHAVPATFQWASFSASGLTTYGVYDTDNNTILQTGDLAQFIWAGPNGLVDLPACDGDPGGDDQLLSTAVIQNSSGPPILQNKGYIFLQDYTYDSEDPQNGGVVYIRAWNASQPQTATAYGNSSTSILNSGGSFNTLRWYTNVPFTIDGWIGSDGGDWSLASNWDKNQVPGSSSTVLIPSGRAVLNASAIVRCLAIDSNATLDLNVHDIAVEDTVTIDGTLRQVQTVNNSTVDFLHLMNTADTVTKYRGVTLDTTADLGVVIVTVRAINPSEGEYCSSTGDTSPVYAERCYTITSENTGGATVTLWALNSELQGVLESALSVFRFDAGAWTQLTENAENGNNGGYVYAQGDTSGFSSFLLGQSGNAPTAVQLQLLGANTIIDRKLFFPLIGIVLAIGFGLWRRKKRQT